MDEGLKRLRGFREIYPEEMSSRLKIFNIMRDVSRRFNFKEIDTPSLEPLELYKLKSGEEIVSQTFSFKDKGGRDVTLVPEITPTVARMVAQKKNMPKPIKWYSIPKLWRYEEPQSGRLREFYQYNADIFGIWTIEADAEVIALAQAILYHLGLGDKYIMRISDRTLIESILRRFDVKDVDMALRLIDRMEKIGEEIFIEEFGKITKEMDIMDFIRLKGDASTISKKLGGLIDDKYLKNIENLENYLKSYNYGNFIFDLSIVRGIAYYTGIVFEAHDVKGELRAILGGGRYDNVVSLFGGEKIPAVGFGMGDAVLEIIMKRENLWPSVDEKVDYFIAIQGDNRPFAIKISKIIREMGKVVEIDMGGKSLSNQLKTADRLGAKNVIIVGDEEKKYNIITLKNLETGEQVRVPIEKINEIVTK
ncbi:MAG: histidine--tRNA ligase [Thermoplasmata archaeon]|jgi:histidyl-tRNA synthetase|nr:histidine--tRNA ligase [Euryarchaeota archaeon]MVT35970.1 histidine--tRNA ligase [Euryarchaeota archaeon]